MKTIFRIVAAAAFLGLVFGMDAAQLEMPPKGQGKYLIVLWDPGTPVPGKKDERMRRVDEPDVAKLGGRVLASQANRRVVFLPDGVAKQLRTHEAVSFVQRIWTGEPLPEWDELETDAALRAAVATDSDPTFTWDRSYAYDADGNITTIGSDAFAYDDLGRLTQATVDGASQTYSYDSFGNLTTIATSGGSSVSVATDPATNRMVGETYDAAGNVTSRKNRGRYYFDSLNMLAEHTVPPVNTSTRRILYDANDERIGTVIDSSLHRWTIRGLDGQILREFTGYDNGLNFVWSWEQDHIRGEGQLIAGETVTWSYYDTYHSAPTAYTYGGKRHYHLDHLGSVRVVTNQAGKAISKNDFFPFGTARTPQFQEQFNEGQRHSDGMRFAGHWRDFMGQQGIEGDDSVDNMHARHYDPNLGRFLSVDPVLGNLIQPQSWNRYAYVFNNPVNFIDPTGMEGVTGGIICDANGCRISDQITVTADDPFSDLLWWLSKRWDTGPVATMPGSLDKAEDFDKTPGSIPIERIWHCIEGSMAPLTVAGGAVVTGAVVAGSGAVLAGVGITAAGPSYGTSLVLVPAGGSLMAAGGYLIVFGGSVYVNAFNNLAGTNVWSPSKQWPRYFPEYPPDGYSPCTH